MAKKAIAELEWKAMDREALPQILDEALTTALPVEAERMQEISEALSAQTNEDLLERVTKLFAAHFPQIGTLCQQVHGVATPANVPEIEPLLVEHYPPIVDANVRLYVARWLVHSRLYDEADVWLAPIAMENVVDPGSLVFYRAIVSHRLLKKDECVQWLGLLLDRESELPKRRLVAVKLLLADIQPLEQDSLDEVARLMDDVGRRLSHSRAGQKTREEQKLVVDKLSKMIDDLEKKAQESSSSSSSQSAAPSTPPAAPANDSQVGNAQGNVSDAVDPKNLSKKSGWGNLPPRERQEVLQRIGKELPSHFRDTVEEYFRKLAEEKE